MLVSWKLIIGANSEINYLFFGFKKAVIGKCGKNIF